MIQCSDCLEWFHMDCLGIKASSVSRILNYYCLGECINIITILFIYVHNFITIIQMYI